MGFAAAYRPPYWLPGGHLQTLYSYFRARKMPVPAFSRLRWETPDGDFVDVDRFSARLEAPLIALFHGLEGSSASHYVRLLAAPIARSGWGLAVAHFRGCSGEPNRLPRAYHSGDSAEVGWMLRQFAAETPGREVAAIGVSLGGNALLKFLGEAGDDAGTLLRCAVAVSAPLDLPVAGNALCRGVNRFYGRAFLATLKNKGIEKAARFPGLIDADRVRRARTLREFDDVVTAPLHGFRDTDDYWKRSSSRPWLRQVRVPTLLVNALNDPFMPGEALPRSEELSSCIECEFTRGGGHVGFVEGAFPGHFGWFAQRIISFVRRHLA